MDLLRDLRPLDLLRDLRAPLDLLRDLRPFLDLLRDLRPVLDLLRDLRPFLDLLRPFLLVRFLGVLLFERPTEAAFLTFLEACLVRPKGFDTSLSIVDGRTSMFVDEAAGALLACSVDGAAGATGATSAGAAAWGAAAAAGATT